MPFFGFSDLQVFRNEHITFSNTRRQAKIENLGTRNRLITNVLRRAKKIKNNIFSPAHAHARARTPVQPRPALEKLRVRLVFSRVRLDLSRVTLVRTRVELVFPIVELVRITAALVQITAALVRTGASLMLCRGDLARLSKKEISMRSLEVSTWKFS